MTGDDLPASAYQRAEAVARQSYGKLIAFLSARSGDVALAEDALAEAFAAALEHWPISGIPTTPEAWLLTAARRQQVDVIRRRQTGERAESHLVLLEELRQIEETDPERIPDDRLRLLFTCAHPAIDASARAPLMLQTVLGFDAAAIASAFLVAPPTMAQRLVRAKNKIRRAGIPFTVPDAANLPDRLPPVLDAVYATFAEAWADADGTDPRRRNVSDEGLWLGRLLASLLPDQAETLGLLALMLHSEARHRARRDQQGRYVRLADQNPSDWNHAHIDEAERLLRRASLLGQVGRYQIEAAIQSAHNHRRISGCTDWPAIEQLYVGLRALTDSPVVVVNHAIALAETKGAAVARAALAGISNDPRMIEYQPYWAACAELARRAGDADTAKQAYDRAIGLEPDAAVRAYLHQARRRMRSAG